MDTEILIGSWITWGTRSLAYKVVAEISAGYIVQGVPYLISCGEPSILVHACDQRRGLLVDRHEASLVWAPGEAPLEEDERPRHGRIIGLAGTAGSGKSTIARVLVRTFGFGLVKFADPMKNMLRAFYDTVGLDYDEAEERIEGDMKAEPDPYLGGKTPRHAMQTLGTEWGRVAIHENLWVKAWESRAALLLEEGIDVVVDDVRFENEVEAIRRLGGLVYRVERPVRDRDPSVLRHVSEAVLREVDRVVWNGGSKEALEEWVKDHFSS